jgi:hypothetical protein
MPNLGTWSDFLDESLGIVCRGLFGLRGCQDAGLESMNRLSLRRDIFDDLDGLWVLYDKVVYVVLVDNMCNRLMWPLAIDIIVITLISGQPLNSFISSRPDSSFSLLSLADHCNVITSILTLSRIIVVSG